MQSLARAQEPSGWIMWHVMVQSHPWMYAHSMDGAFMTVCIVKMQEWFAKVGRCCVYIVIICVLLYIACKSLHFCTSCVMYKVVSVCTFEHVSVPW